MTGNTSSGESTEPGASCCQHLGWQLLVRLPGNCIIKNNQTRDISCQGTCLVIHAKGSSFSNTYTLLAPRRTDRERTHKSRSPAKHFASLTNARQVFNKLLTTALLMTHGKVQGQVHLAGRSSAKVARRGPEEGPLLLPHCVHQCACMSEQIGELHSSSQNCDTLTANYKRPMRKLHRKRRI